MTKFHVGQRVVYQNTHQYGARGRDEYNGLTGTITHIWTDRNGTQHPTVRFDNPDLPQHYNPHPGNIDPNIGPSMHSRWSSQ